MWLWFGLAALALMGELATGTFYLLLVGLGLGAGGLAAALDASGEMALVACSAVILLGLVLLRMAGVLKKREVDSTSNADVNIDIGQHVLVEHWADERRTRVKYRGASWEAELDYGVERGLGRHVITGIRGATLVIAPARKEE